MTKTATQVLQDAIFASVCDALDAFKKNAGTPNELVRDLSAVHLNTAIGDLPASVQQAIQKGTQEAFQRLNKEGFTIAAKNPPARAVAAPKPMARPVGKRRSGQ